MGKGEPDTKSIQSTASQTTTSSVHSKKQGGFLTRMLSRRSKSRGSFDVETGTGTPAHLRKGSSSKVSASEHISTSSKRGNVVECPLCLMERPKDQFPEIITCEHRSCQECLRQYLKIEITESRVNIACPECAEVFHPNDIKKILNDSMLMSKYEEFALRRVLMMDPDCRWCPTPDCGYAVIAAGCASCPEVACQRIGCNTSFCYHCKQTWHPNQTCDAARQQRSGRARKSSLSCSQGSISHQVKPCPRCTALIIKMDDGSCNHMTCAVCGAEFCWLCMKEISDLHYLSPSGCTFWGKKPWSRKKKILWQLGTLVGAPVGIALIAGIAVPAMIIGIPVYVGRKVYWKYSNASKHRRNIAIFGSVSLSIVAAPVLAALTVGIGVPIMLTYVYGVVPFSLCRSGGCGVTTSHGGGVRIEFDDDNDVQVGATNASDINAEVNSAVGNPSIGEVSVARESQLEVVGVLHDDTVSDSASTRAIAGSSLTGSLSGSGGVGPSVIGQNKLDVHFEVSSKRCSLSSESASLNIPDNSSMTAMAGSISEEKGITNISSIVHGPFDVHAEIADKIIKSRHSSGGSSNVDIAGYNPWEPNVSHKGDAASAHRVGGMKKGRSRRSKKNSVKISDHVTETSYHDNDSINDSIHSELSGNMADSETPSECGSSVVGDIATVNDDKLSSGVNSLTGDQQRSNSVDSSNSSVTNHQIYSQEPISSMTEVENDKPTNHLNMLTTQSAPKQTLMSTDL